MPSYLRLPRFNKDHARLSDDEKRAFLEAVRAFVEDLTAHRQPRRSLRVKGVQGAPGVFEMTWAGDGRATFQFGEPVRESEPHIVWRRVGGHDIFSNP